MTGPPLPSADRQTIRQITQQGPAIGLCIVIGGALDTGQGIPRHQHRPMQPDEALRELGFEMGQGIVQQVIALARMRHHVFQIGLQVEDFRHRHKEQPPPLMAGQMGTSAAAHLLADFAKQRRTGRRTLAHFLQRRQQTLGAHRFEQVIDGIEVEGLYGVVIVGRRENHGRRFRHAAEMASQFDAIHARHADVGKHHIDGLFAQHGQGLHAIRRLADHCARQLDRQIAQERTQALAGQRLVVDEQDFQHGFR